MTTTSCPACRAEVRIDLARIPAGRTARVTCPSCQQQYPVTGSAPASPPAAEAIGSARPPGPTPGPEDRAWLRRELEALRAEVEREVTAKVLSSLGVKQAKTEDEDADPERRNALVCEPDPAFAQVLCSALTDLGFVPQVAADMRAAWRGLDREWGVVVVTESMPDEAEAGLKLQERLSRLPGAKRRRMFVVHVSQEVRSLDGGMAFVLNANVVLNRADAASAKEIIKKGMSDHERLYRPFHDATAALHES